MRFSFLTCALLGLLLSAKPSTAAPPLTFCNPINIDYGSIEQRNGSRHGADPVIVLFKNRYYLFDTWDRYGYRVSDDLVHWAFIPFAADTLPLAGSTDKDGRIKITAPAVATNGHYLYYTTFANKNLLRTADPDSGKWELAKTIAPDSDPALFFDTDGRFYETGGMNENHGRELDPKTFEEIKNSRVELTPTLKPLAKLFELKSPYGLFYGKGPYSTVKWDEPGSLDTEKLIPLMQQTEGKEPMIEGSWLTKYKDRYYLQNAAPDTACPWYSDAVWESDKPLGEYKLADYSPAAMKVGGFINSTGHSCLFQDRYGNWWRVTTMWIGTLGGFERRIGLFPAGFDAKGRMFTRTELGDYPIVVPTGPVDADKTSFLAGWSVLSPGAVATASTTLDDKHTANRATDENVRTWWSAKTDDPGEWFQLDLGAPMTVRAVQVNFAEQGTQQYPDTDDYHAYRLLASEDGKVWKTLADKSGNKTAVPHDYIPLAEPVKARFVKVENVHSPKLGKFAIRDLRVFGRGDGAAPAPATDLQIKRLDPAYNVTFTWKPSANADGYVIRYGVAPDALHLNLQVQGGKNDKLTVSCLNADVKYFYRIDAYNKDGLTEGKVTSVAQ